MVRSTSQKIKTIWSQLSTNEAWEQTLVIRIAVAACFIGHGLIALQVAGNFGSEWNSWIRSILPASIEYTGSETLLRAIGLLDIIDGLLLLFPRIPKQALAWVFTWGFATAASRLFFLGLHVPPFELNGLHALAEFLKRTPNWMIPLFLVALTSPKLIVSAWVNQHQALLLRIAVISQMLAIVINGTYERLNPGFYLELEKIGQPEWYHTLTIGLAVAGLVSLSRDTRKKDNWIMNNAGVIFIAAAYCMAEGFNIYAKNIPGGFLYALIRFISHFSMYLSIAWWCRNNWLSLTKVEHAPKLN